jgi:hypothetical protein
MQAAATEGFLGGEVAGLSGCLMARPRATLPAGDDPGNRHLALRERNGQHVWLRILRAIDAVQKVQSAETRH